MKTLAGLCVALILSIVAFAQNTAQNPPTPPKTTYILAGRLFDATSDKVRENVLITIEGDRIKSVASGATAPSGATVIDLSHATVLPGLIDCHTHLSARADRYNPIYRFKDTPFDHAFYAVVNARDVGSPPFLAVDLRNTINEGFIPGPRIVASGPGISITGGHGDLNNYSPETRVSMFP